MPFPFRSVPFGVARARVERSGGPLMRASGAGQWNVLPSPPNAALLTDTDIHTMDVASLKVADLKKE